MNEQRIEKGSRVSVYWPEDGHRYLAIVRSIEIDRVTKERSYFNVEWVDPCGEKSFYRAPAEDVVLAVQVKK